MAALASASLLPGCLSHLDYRGVVEGGVVQVPQRQLARLRSSADALLVRADGMPGVLSVRRVNGSYTALLALCTHRNCEVVAQPAGYDCFCHGSSFDLQGAVLQGPADRPLVRFPVRKTAAGLDIQLT